MKRVLLVAGKTGYQVREFYGAAERLGLELVLATDRCHILDDPWADQATPVQFADPSGAMDLVRRRGPFSGIVAVGDQPALVAGQIAAELGLRFHPAEAVRKANDKFLTRESLRAAGLPVPNFGLNLSGLNLSGLDAPDPRYPCVLKPLHLSASRGVIRANNSREFKEAWERIRKIAPDGPILVEDFIPGREFALEGIVRNGQLHSLTIFDKPDPLDGPFFEETIYITPSRQSAVTQEAIRNATQSAATALGLTDGPVHAEMRVNGEGVWMLEAAARPIGGLCARVLRFEERGGFPTPRLGNLSHSLEELLLENAIGEDVTRYSLIPGAHGVMMIPIAQGGVFQGAEGLEAAMQVPGITEIEITAKIGQKLEPLPEGASYLGFIFARAGSQEEAERSLREARSRLRFHISPALRVVG